MRYDETGKILNIKWHGRWNARHSLVTPGWRDIAFIAFNKLIGKDKPLAYSETQMKNALMDEGEQVVLEYFFRDNDTMAATPFYFGLGNNGGTPGIPAETTTLSGITEVSGTGYSRVAVVQGTSDWGATALDSGDYRTTSGTKSFNATGTWTAADYLFLTDVSSGTAGKLIATVALSASRVLADGDQLDVSMVVKLQ